MKKENRLFCNMCGKEIPMENDMLLEDVLSVRKQWGYFSEQDGMMVEFDLCEECCEKLMKQFRIPPTVTEPTELL
ncbi:MAG: hypothetical protein Q4B57_02895 [Eubacteriales bacterium]|nr:hypothetical protein [Eubacteriales bacterium]